MEDNTDNTTLVTSRSEYTVSEISQALKHAVEDKFSYVRVRGEISKLTLARSGHMYLTLKDENAVLDGVCWRGTVAGLTISPEEGIEVIASGRLSTYSGRSSYQLVIQQMDVAGEGALLKLLNDRREKLATEGLFDQDKKKELPILPDVIGVITSPTGAVFRDILHRLRDRFPRHVLLWPANVQGEGSAKQIAVAIHGFNQMEREVGARNPDLIILARGGGSLEDLWTFNEEIVVRAIADSKIPIISAIGHETDTTLSDLAADQRAPTPTAAAEMAVPVRKELLEKTEDMGGRLVSSLRRLLDALCKETEGLGRGIPDTSRLLETTVQFLDDSTERFELAIENVLSELFVRTREISAGLVNPHQQLIYKQDKLNASARAWHQGLKGLMKYKADEIQKASLALEGVSYQRMLDRGFALVSDEEGPIVSAMAARPGVNINIQFYNGNVRATVDTTNNGGSKREKIPKPKHGGDNSQGNLI